MCRRSRAGPEHSCPCFLRTVEVEPESSAVVALDMRVFSVFSSWKWCFPIPFALGCLLELDFPFPIEFMFDCVMVRNGCLLEKFTTVSNEAFDRFFLDVVNRRWICPD